MGEICAVVMDQSDQLPLPPMTLSQHAAQQAHGDERGRDERSGHRHRVIGTARVADKSSAAERGHHEGRKQEQRQRPDQRPVRSDTDDQESQTGEDEQRSG